MDVAHWFLLLTWLGNALGDINDVSLRVTRHNSGDLFNTERIDKKECKPETCLGLSSGTAGTLPGGDSCSCQCHPHLPAFREDLRICVDDIHECVLAPFVGGSTSQQIPFVFLPLKGQIVHPSKEINFAGIQTPVCAVSGAKYLTETGWVDLRNPIDKDVPLRLFRDEGRTFLQWNGEPELRTKMSGRLILVYLMCREVSTQTLDQTGPALFSPCVAFRVVGSPVKVFNNVSEVAFSPDAHSGSESSERMSVSEYVAIGICSVLLGLIYVASVFLYLHLRKRNRDQVDPDIENRTNITSLEDVVVKNNPLLAMAAQFQNSDVVYSDSTTSENEISDVVKHDEDRTHKQQITSALVHNQYPRSSLTSSFFYQEANPQESSIEKLPEENVSIIETLEGRDERSDNFKALSGTVRRKLYFNPAYFEPQLLLAPPPAALEFLAKIREVITIAKQKMASKRFAPSLMGIPEEDTNYAIDPLYEPFHASVSRRSSIISLKRENSRRKSSCTGCPGCQPREKINGIFNDISSLVVCEGCSSTSENKQRSIRKWLEDIPVLKYTEEVPKVEEDVRDCLQKRLRSPARSLPPEESTPVRALSPRPSSERGKSPHREIIYKQKRKKRQKICKPKAPPPPRPGEGGKERHYDSVPPPEMTDDSIVSRKEELRIPTLTKKQMKAVIEEFSVQRGLRGQDPPKIEYEADSLERNGANQGCSTPSECADMSSQHSPSLSAALPLDEEMTIRNAVLKGEEHEPGEDHDYELIVLRKGQLKQQGFYNLPKMLHRNTDYNLVSEVYVNNGYNYSSNPSSDSDSSSLDKPLKIRYDGGAEKPGKLLIEVEDCLDNYIPVNDSDEFEPDTLDRKTGAKPNNLTDSLEKPRQILLRSNGSFKKNSNHFLLSNPNNFNRAFGSLREIYEAKTAMKSMGSVEELFKEEGKLLTLEKKHTKRQRETVPPDLIPPPPHDNPPIYEQPKPPRKVETVDNLILKPPLPPKNVIGRSANKPGSTQVGTPVDGEQKIWKKFVDGKQDDSGYLSNDSNDNKNRVEVSECAKESESEGSLDEGQSESGAESVETHSVFFGTFRKPTNCHGYESLDSGVYNEKYNAYDIARPLNKASLIT